jgi:hypothetical protein
LQNNQQPTTNEILKYSFCLLQWLFGNLHCIGTEQGPLKKGGMWYNGGMKRIIISGTLFLLTVLFFPLSGPEVSPTNDPGSRMAAQEVLDFSQEDETQEPKEEDDVWYEQEFFQRKLYQKALPSLTNRQAVIWSFRMAEPHTFL